MGRISIAWVVKRSVAVRDVVVEDVTYFMGAAMSRSWSWNLPLCVLGLVSASFHTWAGEVKLLTRPQDPYGWPRPGPGQQHVPLATSFFIEIGLEQAEPSDLVRVDSISVELQRDADMPVTMLKAGRFAAGFSGWVTPRHSKAGQSVLVYIESVQPLEPDSDYSIQVAARSRNGLELARPKGSWRFRTEATLETHELAFELPADLEAVHWNGGFFSGFCSTGFSTNFANRLPTFELMDQMRRTAPRAWSLQRDFWLTGMDDRPRLLPHNLPNIVRERETRRITAIEEPTDGTRLVLDDFWGHQQYGIASNRPLSEDYHAGDEVLIADDEHDAKARVLAVNDLERSVLVSRIGEPAGGWHLKYAGPLPRQEDPNAPGLFPPGGCYLRKFAPAGTPVYYWGRLDKEWDLAIRHHGRRVVVNFADAPGDLSIDGRNWTTAKDYAELHEVVRNISSHIIERYGAATIEFPWSVFNEPDLGILFWRTDWNELQKFYDYTVDAILRAFEDHGYDSGLVRVGGLELGGIFGTNLRLLEFLAHCSPRAEAPGAVEQNAAFADPRLDGKRSKRVETLCRGNAGCGSPCDFVSIHSYNRSKLMADKLARAKEMALELDAEYFKRLAIHSHESCPGWDNPPDPAFSDSYLGNGYYETWCADVIRRQLARAAADSRYAFGESILTFWAFPIDNFDSRNDCARRVHVDDDGDGREDRTTTIAMPILHFLGLVAEMGDNFQVLPEQVVGGHVVSGFAARTADVLRVLLYSHHELDTQTRSIANFNVTLKLAGIESEDVEVTQFQFDKEHNSYFQVGRALRDRAAVTRPLAVDVTERIQAAVSRLESPDHAEQQSALRELSGMGREAAIAVGALGQFVQQSSDASLRGQAQALIFRLVAPAVYTPEEVKQIEELAVLRPTSRSSVRTTEQHLQIKVPLEANGANYIVVKP